MADFMIATHFKVRQMPINLPPADDALLHYRYQMNCTRRVVCVYGAWRVILGIIIADSLWLQIVIKHEFVLNYKASSIIIIALLITKTSISSSEAFW